MSNFWEHPLTVAIIQSLVIALAIKFLIDILSEKKYENRAKKEILEFYKAIQDEDSERIIEIILYMDQKISPYFQKFIRMRLSELKPGKYTEFGTGDERGIYTHRNEGLLGFKFLILIIQEMSEVMIYERWTQGSSFTIRQNEIAGSGNPEAKKNFLEYLDKKIIENKIYKNWFHRILTIFKKVHK